ncbi:UNVERIFIED_CONTAM: hypothetical protein GTU68_024105 [Idotea baltica]|nr:hypothetical protein [Idotea baltica]
MFLQFTEACRDPRTIKTHLPFSLLAKDLLDTCKVVYVIRNLKDVVTSYHHHSRLLKQHGFVGTLDSFVDHFVNDKLLYGPFWTHAKEAWDKRDHRNLHFMFYEDMIENPKGEIMKLQKFLGTNLTDKQIDDV